MTDDAELRELVRRVAREVLERDGDAGLSPAVLTTELPIDAPAGRGALVGAFGTGSGSPANDMGHRSGSPADPLAARVALWTGRPIDALEGAAMSTPLGDRASLLAATPARLGVGRAGTRLRTATLLAFLADHAAARDAVRSEVDTETIAKLGLVPLQSAARDRTEFLLRPDLGRALAPESLTVVQAQGKRSPKVQVVVVDGLSAAAIRANLPAVLPVVLAELQREGIDTGPVFFVARGRMAAGDPIGRAVGAEVLCTIVGERPGLGTAESMGAYVTYLGTSAINESMRSMISNIHRGGVAPEEGAKHIAALCVRALRERRTGVDEGAR